MHKVSDQGRRNIGNFKKHQEEKCMVREQKMRGAGGVL